VWRVKVHPMRTLVAIPVYNEARYVRRVLARVLEHASDVLVIDDGSTDATPRLLPEFPVEIIRHAKNRGYGKSLRDALRYAIAEDFDWLVTMDCDEQHEPAAIPSFLEEAARDRADVISGSRYLLAASGDDAAPPDRRVINATITDEINARLFPSPARPITDAFCGFKAYRVESLRRLRPTVSGYAFPMQFWAQAVAAGLRVLELPVRRIYNDPSRTFGGHLDDAAVRLAHYRHILHREIKRLAASLPAEAVHGLTDRESPGACTLPCPA